jgi:quinol-cytochrome oxidoreductase complex cytochrome b subunit
MNQFESILHREKEAEYRLQNSQLFAFAVMAKIASQRSKRKLQKIIFSIALVNLLVVGVFFINPGNPIDNAFGWIFTVALLAIFQISQSALALIITCIGLLLGTLGVIGVKSRE